MNKIVTNQKQIPWTWAVVILFPWFTFAVRETISNAGMTFTLRKFIDNPAIIGLVLSSNYAFSLTVGAFIAFISDYIWTPFGRRRPFLVISLLSAGVLSLFIPLSGSLWLVIALIVVYQLMVDFTGPYEPFTMEVIPSPQRGRAQAITQWYKMLGNAVVLTLLIGNFDKIYNIAGSFTLNGEKVMYWANSAFLITAGCILAFFVREQKPADHQPVSIRKILVQKLLPELFNVRMFYIMGLYFVMQNLWSGAFQYEALLITDQWGYSKEIYGRMLTLSMLLTIALVPIAGWLSDRIDRMILLKFCLFTVLSIKILFYAYVQYIVVGSPPMFIVFLIGFMKSTLGSFMGVACIPLLFDYVHRNRLGTLGCAMALVASLIAFVSTNVMGVWITFSSKYIYRLPAGDYDYMTAYHWVIIMGIAGIAYLYYFSYAEKKGRIQRVESNLPDAATEE